MVCEGMAEMLSLNEDIEIVGQSGDGREAVELAKETKPDVVILDLEMPVIGAQAALRRLLELSPPPKVVMLPCSPTSARCASFWGWVRAYS